LSKNRLQGFVPATSLQGAPYNYDYANVAESVVQPSTMWIAGTASARYHRRQLYQLVAGVLKFTQLEAWEKWAADYMPACLLCLGRVAILRTDRFGVIPQQCGLGGYGVLYQPTTAIVTNPLLRYRELPIGTLCSVVKLRADWGGIYDTVVHYANLLALADEALAVNMLNSRLAYVFAASERAGAESLKKLFDAVASGEPAVVADRKLFNDDGSPAWGTFAQDLRSNFISPEIINVRRAILEAFCHEVGIPAANTGKRERLNTDEVHAQDVETSIRMDDMIDHMQRGFAEACELFGLPDRSIWVEWRRPPEEMQLSDEEVLNV